MTKRYLPTKFSKAKCLLLIGLIIFLYLIENSPIVSLIGSGNYNYFIKPILFLGLAFIIWILPEVRPIGNLRQKKSVNFWALNFAVIFIVVSVLAGLIDGLGKSPYSHSFYGIITNTFSVGSVLMGRELVRNYLVNSFTNKENYLVFFAIGFFMTFTNIPINKFINFSGYTDFVKFIAQFFAPEFSRNMFATYLAFLGGPLPTLIYLGILDAFHWFSPILPDLQWITTALVGVLCPIFSLTVMQAIFCAETKALKKSEIEEDNPLGWILTAISSIAIIWFVIGVFPIYPSVIATGSMEPMIKPGDVILVEKIQSIEDINNLEDGDVIQFIKDNILISHRILEVKEDGGSKSFHTKGDNNSSPDFEPVEPEQIKGRIIKVIPKVGWPTLLIKSDLGIN